MATYYVSTQNGNDSNNGTTAALAKKTVSAGLALMSAAGDILYIGPGVYYHTTTNNIPRSGLITNPCQIIGDTQAQYLTNDAPGEVILTAMNSSTLSSTRNIIGLNFSADEYWHVKNLTFAGYMGSSGTGITANNSDGVVIENCHFSNSGYGVFGDANDDVTVYNCSSVGCYVSFYSCNAINCVAIGAGSSGFNQSYTYACLALGCVNGFFQCYCDEYGAAFTDTGATYNSTAIGCNNGFNDCTGQNNLTTGCNSGFNFGNGNMIGCYSAGDYTPYNNGDTSATGIFPNINSGSRLSSCYCASYHFTPNFSTDDVNFIVTETKGMHYTGYVGMCNDILQIFKTRPIPGQQYFYTGSSGQPWFSTKITGSATPLGTRPEALRAFVSGSGVRFSANWLKGTYVPPAKHDPIGMPMGNLSTTPGFTEYSRLQGAFPGHLYPDSQEMSKTYVTGSNYAIKIQDYGAFSLAANISGSITASISVRYVAGTPPKLILIDKLTNGKIVSASASGTGNQTGSWQTLTVSTKTSNPMNVVLLNAAAPTGYNPYQGSNSTVYFSNFIING
jgi:hypothetical protein